MGGRDVEFVAVGRGHLLGRDGLVAQLRARGFRLSAFRERTKASRHAHRQGIERAATTRRAGSP